MRHLIAVAIAAVMTVDGVARLQLHRLPTRGRDSDTESVSRPPPHPEGGSGAAGGNCNHRYIRKVFVHC